MTTTKPKFVEGDPVAVDLGNRVWGCRYDITRVTRVTKTLVRVAGYGDSTFRVSDGTERRTVGQWNTQKRLVPVTQEIRDANKRHRLTNWFIGLQADDLTDTPLADLKTAFKALKRPTPKEDT